MASPKKTNWLAIGGFAAVAFMLVTQGLIALALLRGPIGPSPLPSPTPGPSPTNLRAIVTNKADAKRLSDFYAALAGVLERDAGTVAKTTGVFRTARQKATLAAFQGTDLASKYNITPEIDRRVLAALGSMEDATLDATKRAALVAALKQIAAELGG